MNENLVTEIRGLIALGTEGTYWDFKGEWHENNADLLHDIICMANNIDNRDAYIIIGVSDPPCCKVSGNLINNKKTQQNLIDFLKDKKFAGDIRPTVYVKTLQIENNEIDIIIVKTQ